MTGHGKVKALEEEPCKICGIIFPVDHLTQGLCMLCFELIPEEARTGN